MKCRRCKAPALIDVRRHNAAFCADCFVHHCREQVRRAIDGFDMIRPGERVLIMGESGAGKSTLFRAISGLWPWGSGKVRIPKPEEMMFLPQRPYLPLGTLRAAISYPAAPETFDDAEVRGALERCGLGEFVDMLDRHERWDRSLSLGQQQRVAFARVLLHRPRWVFMDEATSALDETSQTALMSLAREALPDTTLISIGHRPGLEAFHDRRLTLVRHEDGARLICERALHLVHSRA